MRFDHVGLAVSDLSASADWYCDAFGLGREVALRIEDIELDLLMLLAPDGYRLELLHRPGITARPPGDPADAAATAGFGHVAFAVEDVDASFALLLAKGASAVMHPQPSPEPGVRMCFVADPEGNLIELVSRPVSGR